MGQFQKYQNHWKDSLLPLACCQSSLKLSLISSYQCNLWITHFYLAFKNIASWWYVFKIKSINKKSEKDVTRVLKKTKQKINHGHVFIIFIFERERLWARNNGISVDAGYKENELQEFNWENIWGIIEVSIKHEGLSTES